MTTRILPLLAALAVALPGTRAPGQEASWDRKRRKAAEDLATRWWKARPKTRFEAWDPKVRAELQAEAVAFGAIPEGRLADVVETLWKPVRRHGFRPRGSKKVTFDTPFGPAWFLVRGRGKGRGLVIGLHGGGEGAGSAGEAAGKWVARGCLGVYPQAIHLVHDAWNTVHGERFLLTIMEIAKSWYQVDPDRIYVMGFSMGGTGSWFLAGRHPDWLAGSAPCAGVLMARPKSQLARKEEVRAVQHGLVPNVRNLAMYYFTGLKDRNCMPGTYLFVADRLDELREEDPEGWGSVRFEVYPELAHAMPPGEPAGAIRHLTEQRRVTFPRKLVWEYASRPFPKAAENAPLPRLQKHHFYWLHCAEPRDRQTIRASVEDNVVTLEAWGTADRLRGITIFLNARMIDPEKDVVVRAEGEEVWRGRPEPELWAVLQTMDARLDRKMVFDRRIAL